MISCALGFVSNCMARFAGFEVSLSENNINGVQDTVFFIFRTDQPLLSGLAHMYDSKISNSHDVFMEYWFLNFLSIHVLDPDCVPSSVVGTGVATGSYPKSVLS